MRRTVLIVDDEEKNRRILEGFLNSFGYATIEAASGEKALEKAERERPDLILLDIMMPGLDGYEVCRELKARGENGFIPIIFVTALEDKEAKIKGLEAGADDFLTKPVDELELSARIRSLIRIKEYYEDLKEVNKKLINNIIKARSIQRSLIPQEFPCIPGLCFSGHYQPAEHLGGDFYDILELDGDRLAFYVADVAGHGLDAAMLTIFLKEELRTLLFRRGIRSPLKCLQGLEKRFQRENFPEDIFITVFLCILDIRTLKMTYSSAGFIAFPLVFDGETIKELYCPGSLITSFEDEGFYQEKEIILHPGEEILFFTDGLVEQDNEKGEMFGLERVKEIVTKFARKEGCLLEELISELEGFAGRDVFNDDVSMLNVKVK